MVVKRFDGKEGNVWKYVFDFGDAIAEAVLYKYQDFYKRTVICCSVMSGCPIGCKFCGTGKKFIRNLTRFEITDQIRYILKDMNLEDINGKGKKFQIMFMSMGEPLLNWNETNWAINGLHNAYRNAQLLVSTVGLNDYAFDSLIQNSKYINKLGLQFSIHESNENKRNELIPYKNKFDLRKIRDKGIEWYEATGRQVYLNYCVTEDNFLDYQRLMDLFSPRVFAFTFSVVCEANETMKDAHQKNLNLINLISDTFLKAGYNTRVFDPAGQDDIGGGCGQLWYVQEWMKNNKK